MISTTTHHVRWVNSSASDSDLNRGFSTQTVFNYITYYITVTRFILFPIISVKNYLLLFSRLPLALFATKEFVKIFQHNLSSERNFLVSGAG